MPPRAIVLTDKDIKAMVKVHDQYHAGNWHTKNYREGAMRAALLQFLKTKRILVEER
jgi:hypothetical protein